MAISADLSTTITFGIVMVVIGLATIWQYGKSTAANDRTSAGMFILLNFQYVDLPIVLIGRDLEDGPSQTTGHPSPSPTLRSVVDLQ